MGLCPFGAADQTELFAIPERDADVVCRFPARLRAGTQDLRRTQQRYRARGGIIGASHPRIAVVARQHQQVTAAIQARDHIVQHHGPRRRLDFELHRCRGCTSQQLTAFAGRDGDARDARQRALQRFSRQALGGLARSPGCSLRCRRIARIASNRRDRAALGLVGGLPLAQRPRRAAFKAIARRIIPQQHTHTAVFSCEVHLDAAIRAAVARQSDAVARVHTRSGQAFVVFAQASAYIDHASLHAATLRAAVDEGHITRRDRVGLE